MAIGGHCILFFAESSRSPGEAHTSHGACEPLSTPQAAPALITGTNPSASGGQEADVWLGSLS